MFEVLSHKEKQIKTTLRFHVNPARLSSRKSQLGWLASTIQATGEADHHLNQKLERPPSQPIAVCGGVHLLSQ
jgi:hypothetical protein